MSVLVGIAGGTGSGKTSLAVKVCDRVGEDRCLLLAQDAYYKDGSTLSPAAQAAINYDHPDAFDTSLLVQDLRDLRAGRPVPHLTYDHASYARRVLPDPLTPKPVVILEGILVLAEEPLRRLMDIKLFIDTDADVRHPAAAAARHPGPRPLVRVGAAPVPRVGAPDAPRVRRAVEALRRPDHPGGRRERGGARGGRGARAGDALAMRARA